MLTYLPAKADPVIIPWIITGSALGGKYVSMDIYRVGLRR
jgi:hypothetical protein